jgi:hypothetical protein
MKKFLTMALVGAVMLGAGSFAYANVCAFDNAPSATLLYPFVAYNYTDGANGVNTLFSVTNTSSEAQIVHVTVWTDFSIAILDFNILLTGYDIQAMDIRTILANGQLPVTTVGGHTQTEGIVDDGPISSANEYSPFDPFNPNDPQATSVLSSRCSPSDQAYPGKYSVPIPANILALFEGWLKSSQTVPRYHENCDLVPYVPQPTPWFEGRGEADDTWMYITADVVENCNTLFPDESGYFGIDGQIRYDNVLIGDTLWVNDAERFSEGSNAVHIEADFALPFIATPGPLGEPVSFYHRYAVAGQQVESDLREPLPTAWAFRFLNDPTNGLSSYLRVFKASSANAVVPDLVRASPDETPSELWARNCLAYTYYAWDEDENVTTTSTMPWSMPGGETVILNLLPLETQEVNVNQFNILDGNGWMLFVWPASNWNAPIPPTFEFFDLYQTWMGVKYVKEGDYSAFIPGAVMANFNCFPDQVLPYLGWNDSNMYSE